MTQTGIVTALIPEARCLGAPARLTPQPLPLSDSLLLLICGQGSARAAEAANRLLDAGAGALVSFGTAGGLRPEVRPGDLLLPEVVLDAAGARLPVDRPWRDRLAAELGAGVDRMHTAPLMSHSGIVTEWKEKTTTYADTGAFAVDLESAAVLAVARKRGVPGVVVRVVVDAADIPVSDLILRHSDPWGRPRILSLSLGLALSPRRIPEIWRLARAFATARESMSRIGRRRELLAYAPRPA